MLAGIKKTMDISLLADPVFLIYGISCFLCMAGMLKLHSFTRNTLLYCSNTNECCWHFHNLCSLTGCYLAGFYVPFTYLPPHAAAMGLSKNQGAGLISIIGIANTVARVVCGFISDLPSVDALLLNNLALVIAGVATFLCPLCYNFALLAVYAAVFGCGIGMSTSML